ncbi:MAG TPA: rhodanese-like domain-containing protein [Candidatus Paceibacterota bacterium]|nr:rhodanese-like domain-containing protein [Candidatus Paceibacterota bacterium]
MIYIDVRTPEEFASGHYPNAINHPVELIMQGILPELAKDTEINLYCRSGARAGIAQQMMQQAGFTNVTNKGGLSDLT